MKPFCYPIQKLPHICWDSNPYPQNKKRWSNPLNQTNLIFLISYANYWNKKLESQNFPQLYFPWWYEGIFIFLLLNSHCDVGEMYTYKWGQISWILTYLPWSILWSASIICHFPGLYIINWHDALWSIICWIHWVAHRGWMGKRCFFVYVNLIHVHAVIAYTRFFPSQYCDVLSLLAY